MPYLYLIAGILNICLGFYVFKKSSKEKENRFFVIVAILIGLWCLVNVFYLLKFNYPWLNLTYTIGIFLMLTILIWVSYFTKKIINRVWIYIFVLFTTAFSAISLVPNYFINSYLINLKFGFKILTGPFFIWYSFYALILLLYSILLLIKRRDKVFGFKKTQYNYVSFGFIIPILLIALFDFILSLFNIFNYASIDFIASLIFVVTISYSITRYRFMDIRVIIRKGIIYAISLIFTLAIYTYLALVLRDTIEKSWNIIPTLTTLIIVGLVALGFPLLKKLIEKLINSIFKGKESIDLAVKELKSKMAYETDFANLINIIINEIKKYLEISAMKFYILNQQEKKFIAQTDDLNESINIDNDLVRFFEKNNDILVTDEIPHLAQEKNSDLDVDRLKKAEKELYKQKAGLAMPLRTEEGVFGVVLLGNKTDQQAYTVQDINYLEQLREQVNFTIAHALLYRNTMAGLKERGRI